MFFVAAPVAASVHEGAAPTASMDQLELVLPLRPSLPLTAESPVSSDSDVAAARKSSVLDSDKPSVGRVVATAAGRLAGDAALTLAKGFLTASAVVGGLLLAGSGALWMFDSAPLPAPVADIADAGRDLVIERAGTPAPIAMPSVVGTNLADAKQQLRDAGYRNIHATDAAGDKAVLWPKNWTVVGQDPPMATALQPGQRITLTVTHDQ